MKSVWATTVPWLAKWICSAVRVAIAIVAKGAAAMDYLVVCALRVTRWSPANAVADYALEQRLGEPVRAIVTALEAASIATVNTVAFEIVNARKVRAVSMRTSHRTKRGVAAAAPVRTFAARRLAKQAPGVAQ